MRVFVTVKAVLNILQSCLVKQLGPLCQDITKAFCLQRYTASQAVHSLEVADADCWLARQFIDHNGLLPTVHCKVTPLADNGRRNCHHWEQKDWSLYHPAGVTGDPSDHSCKNRNKASDVFLQQIAEELGEDSLPFLYQKPKWPKDVFAKGPKLC